MITPLRNPFALAGLSRFILVGFMLCCFAGRLAHAQDSKEAEGSQTAAVTPASPSADGSTSRATVLITSLTVFILAVFIGFEIINKIPPTLHTPLMSGSNAISGITIIGALIVAGISGGFASVLGWFAIVLAMINVVGGFLVTHRMLAMFKRR